MTPQFACNYAVLRFLPYRETGEFVNLGVVLLCEQTGTFDFRIETRRSGRVTNFFPELEARHFRQTRDFIEEELKRLKTFYALAGQKPADPAAFLNLVRPREAVFQFGKMGTMLAEDTTTAVERLFHHFVNRQFAQRTEYQEEVMANRYRTALQEANLWGKFKADLRVGNETYHAILPLAAPQADTEHRATIAIKPLNLERDEPTHIYDHGAIWINKIERLREIDYLPQTIVFPTRFPTGEQACINAGRAIKHRLECLGVTMLSYDDAEGVLALAQTAV